jgi:adenylyltransferase/sulfurtransferase
MIADYDLVADGTDNFRTRYLLNDVCVQMKKTLVSAALLRFDGQLGVFKPHAGEAYPCYRCIFPEEPPQDLIPRCETAGIFGAVAGILGSLQATEVLKEILGLGDTMAGRLMLYDGLSAQIRVVKVKRRADCPSCSNAT